ncbi:FtsB family cell division protein [Sphingomonas sp.]|jgi:cell division protein FtsB|uniref:FtsB family cell division protein n=1 Tax=Sphingomonas sp. TaxID=28214 RepID=UPI002E356130|nr:septum formation initiator family protein [Sphingomonas sp.]HEX4693376.1 septum formation initiator family protein [Sphingomonas sp.]
MSRSQTTFRNVFRRAALPALALGFIAFFGIYAVVGSNGALAYGDYQRMLARQQMHLVQLKNQQAVLANRVRLLDPNKVDPDIADELTRKQLNVVNPNEVVVPLK